MGPFDLVAVPIGAYEPVAMMRESHMNPEEAIAAALDLQAKKAIAIHYGTFDLSDEPLAEPPKRFLEAAKSSALGGSAAWIIPMAQSHSPSEEPSLITSRPPAAGRAGGSGARPFQPWRTRSARRTPRWARAAAAAAAATTVIGLVRLHSCVAFPRE